MKVIVSGAGGFVGRNLACRLAAAGHELLLIALRPDPSLGELPGAELRLGPAHEVFGGLDPRAYDAFVHLASSTNPRVGGMQEELAQLGALAEILEHAAQAPALQVVFLSSGGTVYAESPDPHREDEALAPRIPYAWGKAAAEELLRYHGRRRGLRWAVLRCANAYGPWQVVKKQGLVMRLLRDLEQGRTTEVWGDGEERRDYLFVDDLCALLECALARPETCGVFNAGSGVGTSVNELIALTEASLGRALSIRHVAAIAGAVRCSVLAREKPREVYGWEPQVGLLEGIARTWSWIESQGA